MKPKNIVVLALLLASFLFCRCQDDNSGSDGPVFNGEFYFGADLSYVNQILDHDGIYKVNGIVDNPFKIFANHGTDIARFRIWHNPQWTSTIYDPDGPQLYNDLYDIEKAIAESKSAGMKVLLDFHYADSWADPGKQPIPAAWTEITSIDDLADSVYNYTLKSLAYLESKGLMPEYVQLGNEINCGLLFTEAPANFPSCYACDGSWSNLRQVIKAGIKAVHDVSNTSSIKAKVLLHVADPKNVEWWFDNVINAGEINNFDIIGFSYYPLWHTTVPLAQISDKTALFKSKFGKDVMILETAYPWTANSNDGYNNIFGSQTPLTGFPFSKKGQLDMLKSITQEMIDGGGIGIFYWEPAWITSNMKDLWGTGSSWENCTFFDYNGNATEAFGYMTAGYNK